MREINSISVCLATYNGEKHLRRQLDSIIEQLRVGDELIVVDDASTDRTAKVLEEYSDFLAIVEMNRKNIGHVQAFARAIGLARNSFVVMADQDDIWIKGRLELLRSSLVHTKALLVTGNSLFIDDLERPIPAIHPEIRVNDSRRYYRNITNIFLGSAFYDGCAMGFRQSFVDIILPIPAYVQSHDLWLAMAANILRSNVHIAEYLLLRRIHGSNASVGARSLAQKLFSRIIFARSCLEIILRVRRRGVLRDDAIR